MKDLGNTYNSWRPLSLVCLCNISQAYKDKGFYTTGSKAMRDKSTWRPASYVEEKFEERYARIVSTWKTYAQGLYKYIIDSCDIVRDRYFMLFGCIDIHFSKYVKCTVRNDELGIKYFTFTDGSMISSCREITDEGYINVIRVAYIKNNGSKLR
jgi:hypothetical protein